VTSLFPRLSAFGRHLVQAKNRLISPLCQSPIHDLIIFDDVFPQPLSAFRLLEFTAYLKRFSKSTVYSTGDSFPLLGESRSLSRVITDFEVTNPDLRNRVHPFNAYRRRRSRIAYTIFAANSNRFAEAANRSGASTVFTLYPGGGFRLDEKKSNAIMLRRVISGRSFRKVIVTQKVTLEYLLEQQLCNPDQIEFIYGGVFPRHNPETSEKPRFQESKKTFDVCFVAHKYTPQGRDKGYDVFIDVSRRLSSTCPQARFHVVGPFTPEDRDVAALGNLITFHGVQNGIFFKEFYRQMDIILSPNAPFILALGAFDGFPTGACIEAGLCGVVVVATDCLSQNIFFKDGYDIVIITRDADLISQRIDYLYRNLTELRALSDHGRESFSRVFSFAAQMEPRFRILETLLRE
jgi:glycosyltransferase involved in cell wall biosynthesis